MTTNVKQQVYQLLSNVGKIHLPEIRDPEQTGIVAIPKQESMFIGFDSVKLIESDSSMIDFIISKGSAEVLVALSDGWLKLTDEQRSRIESAGKSFMILRTDLTADWHSAICFGNNKTSVKLEPFGVVESYTLTTYWVYHNRHGWQNGAQ